MRILRCVNQQEVWNIIHLKLFMNMMSYNKCLYIQEFFIKWAKVLYFSNVPTFPFIFFVLEKVLSATCGLVLPFQEAFLMALCFYTRKTTIVFQSIKNEINYIAPGGVCPMQPLLLMAFVLKIFFNNYTTFNSTYYVTKMPRKFKISGVIVCQY